MTGDGGRFPAWVRGDWAIPLALVALRVAVYVALPEPYGYFRDEMYYMACADHPAWGYVDQPPFSIWVLGVSRYLFGASLFALRLVPLAATCAASLITAALAREMGGGRYAMAVAALAAVITPIYLAHSSFYSMNSIEVALYAAAFWVLLRWANSENPRWWLAFGLVGGIGLLNKWTFGLFGLALAAGIVSTPRRVVFREPRFWIGGAVAAALFAPHVIWQVTHHWPMLEFTRNARLYKMAGFAPLDFIGSQLLIMNPVAAILWLAGVVDLLIGKRTQPYRFLGRTFVFLQTAQILTGAKSYYPAPAYTLLLAAGAVWLASKPVSERWTAARLRAVRTAVPALVALGGLALAPLSMPLLAPETFVRYSAALGVEQPRDERVDLAALPQFFADRFGWKNLVDAVARVYHALPAEDRERAAIFAGNYGEAGAIDLWGPALGLPKAISTHNSFWLWGPGNATGEVVIAFGVDRDKLVELFESVEEAARVSTPYAMPRENNQAIYLCRGLKMPVAEFWAANKHYI